MSDKLNTYGETEQARWSHIHSEECNKKFGSIFDVVKGAINKLIKAHQGNNKEFIFSVLSSKFWEDAIRDAGYDTLSEEDVTKFLERAIMEIEQSYSVFATLAISMRYQWHTSMTLYDFTNDEVPVGILDWSEGNFTDISFGLFWITRKEHYISIMRAIRNAKKPLQIKHWNVIIFFQDNKIKLEIHTYPNWMKVVDPKKISRSWLGNGILARKPFQRAKIVIHNLEIPPSAYDTK